MLRHAVKSKVRIHDFYHIYPVATRQECRFASGQGIVPKSPRPLLSCLKVIHRAELYTIGLYKSSLFVRPLQTTASEIYGKQSMPFLLENPEQNVRPHFALVLAAFVGIKGRWHPEVYFVVSFVGTDKIYFLSYIGSTWSVTLFRVAVVEIEKSSERFVSFCHLTTT